MTQHSRFIPTEKLRLQAPLMKEIWIGNAPESWQSLEQSVAIDLLEDCSAVFAPGSSHYLEKRLTDGQYCLVLTPQGQHDLRAHLRVRLIIAAHTKVKLYLYDAASSLSWSALEGSIVVEPHASLEVVMLRHHAAPVNTTTHFNYELQPEATATIFYSLITGNFDHHQLNIQLNDRAQANVFGLILNQENFYRGFEPSVEHIGTNARSSIQVKSLNAGSSVTLVKGMIKVAPNAKKTEAHYSNHNLVLSQRSKVIAQPELDIEYDDVVCTHGVTLGRLDDAALFYLQTRGLSLIESQNLLIHAFIGALIEKMPEGYPLDAPRGFASFIQSFLEQAHELFDSP